MCIRDISGTHNFSHAMSESLCQGDRRDAGHSKAGSGQEPRRHEKAGNDAEMEAVFKRVHFTDSQSISTEKKPAEDGSSDVLFNGFQKSLLNSNAGSNVSYSNLLNSPDQEIKGCLDERVITLLRHSVFSKNYSSTIIG